MSKYYGTVIGNANTPAGRRGFHEIRVAAQTWDGSIIVNAYDTKDEKDVIWRIEVSESSDTYGKKIWEGTISDFIDKLKD